jgi:beta-lactam-binding protein with PASTA domain/predicted Ser/Thr protein kinase
MAEVYLARDDLLGRSVALKVLHPEFARDRGFIERFRREAQSAARLNDPKVVSIFDWGSDDGTYFIVMEFVDGKTLREIAESEGPLTVDRAAEIVADVCDALHLAHEQGIVHRDVKPGNVIITNGGQTKVTDFGIARAASDSGQTVTQTGTVIGTAAYLSPEQAQGIPVDARSDVYSAAVVLYELLTGDVPFTGDTPVAIAFKHVQQQPTPPSTVNREVPPEFDAIVMKGLAKNPENRYHTAQEMASDLRRALRGEPVTATPLLDQGRTEVSERTSIVAGVPVDRTTQAMPVVEPAPRRRAFFYTLTTLLFVGILAALVALLISLLSRGGQTVVVPGVLGEGFAEADEILEDAGLDAERGAEEPSDRFAAGQVMAQDPGEGERVTEGAQVTLTISTGPDAAEVPEVVGLPEAEARAAIERAGFQVGSVSQQPSGDAAPGLVIDQDPDPGARLRRGESVSIVVSSGKPRVQVPELEGLTEEDARNQLLRVGLVPKVDYTCETQQNDNRVLDQNPDAGAEVEEGSQVTVVVNDTRTVPGVIGESEEDAVDRLQEAGFRVVVVEQDRVPTEDDRVVDQDPDGGTVGCSGDTVRIFVEK